MKKLLVIIGASLLLVAGAVATYAAVGDGQFCKTADRGTIRQNSDGTYSKCVLVDGGTWHWMQTQKPAVPVTKVPNFTG